MLQLKKVALKKEIGYHKVSCAQDYFDYFFIPCGEVRVQDRAAGPS